MVTPQRFVSTVEAMLVSRENAKDVCDWVHSHLVRSGSPLRVAWDDDGYGKVLIGHGRREHLRCDVGNWLVLDVHGRFAVYLPDGFASTFEPAPVQV